MRTVLPAPRVHFPSPSSQLLCGLTEGESMTDRKTEPCIMVLFGATGDLARRKLIPALYNLYHDGLLPKNFAVCAYARKPKSEVEFRAESRAEVDKYSRQKT